MVRETREIYCDACGDKMVEYEGYVDLIKRDENGYAYTDGLDLCKDCMISFNKWLNNRRIDNGYNPKGSERHR